MARPASLDKKQFGDFAKDGALVKPIDLAEPSDAVQETLIGMDVVISCLTLLQLKEELNLVEAARAAGVGRYVPSFFGPCCPPRGVMLLREMVRSLPLQRERTQY